MLDEVFFTLNQSQNKWIRTELFPLPPNLTILRIVPEKHCFTRGVEVVAPRHLEVFCRTHKAWEKALGYRLDKNGKKCLLAACGYLNPPPFSSEMSRNPFAYSFSQYGRESLYTFKVYNVVYRGERKIKEELKFTISIANGNLESSEKKFDVMNEKLPVPSEVIKYVTETIGSSFKKEFGYVPTLTSKIQDLSVISGYVKYPFNANLVELQKVAGIRNFQIERDDSLNEKKMYDFLGIKPSKVLKKKYQEYPYAPILFKFFELMGFKDMNLTNPKLDCKFLYSFLVHNWVGFDDETQKIYFVGQENIIYFVNESRKRNGEKTVLSALLKSIKTELTWLDNDSFAFLGYSRLYDTIGMLQANQNFINEEIKKEIFHDGIGERTHDNLVNMFHGMSQAIDEARRNEPFDYSESDLLLEYTEVETKTNKVILEFFLPKNESELLQFGQHMHNCVGRGLYTNSVWSKKCVIVGVKLYGKAYICLEIKKSEIAPGKRKIAQALGICNNVLDVEQKGIVLDWAYKKQVDPGWLAR